MDGVRNYGIQRFHLDPHDGKLHSTQETLLCAREGLRASRRGERFQGWRAAQDCFLCRAKFLDSPTCYFSKLDSISVGAFF